MTLPQITVDEALHFLGRYMTDARVVEAGTVLEKAIAEMDNRYRELHEAAKRVFENAVDMDDWGPDEPNDDHDDFPRDEDGMIWWPEMFALRQALYPQQ